MKRLVFSVCLLVWCGGCTIHSEFLNLDDMPSVMAKAKNLSRDDALVSTRRILAKYDGNNTYYVPTDNSATTLVTPDGLIINQEFRYRHLTRVFLDSPVYQGSEISGYCGAGFYLLDVKKAIRSNEDVKFSEVSKLQLYDIYTIRGVTVVLWDNRRSRFEAHIVDRADLDEFLAAMYVLCPQLETSP